jgi:hypothetical protein
MPLAAGRRRASLQPHRSPSCIMRLLLLSLLACSALALPVAAQTQLTMNDLMAVPVKVRGADCALFPAAALFDTLDLRVSQVNPFRFTPTRQQVEATENQLAVGGIRAIRTPLSPPDSANLAYIQTHLPDYKRQYFGFYNEKHQACIFIQLFEGGRPDWLYHHLVFLDGGASIWEVCYNLDTQQFYFFGYHSEA